MTDSHASDRDVDRAIRSWLHEDRHEDASRLAGAVLDQVDTIPQRRYTWWPARRTPIMSKIVGFGLVAAAVVVALLLGGRFVGPPTNVGKPDVEATATPEATATAEPAVAEPSGDLPQGSHLLWDGMTAGAQISVTIPAPDWYGERRAGILQKYDNSHAPDGAELIVFAGPTMLSAGQDLYVYGDPCQWSTTRPDTPVTTVDEAVAALASQALRDASTPVDVTVGGHAGKLIILHVPDDARFSDCDQGEFRTLIQGTEASETAAAPQGARRAQDPGQIEKLWVLDVNGDLVIIDAGYYKGTSQSVVDELHAIVESASLASPRDAAPSVGSADAHELPAGSLLLWDGAPDGVSITVTIPGPGWWGRSGQGWFTNDSGSNTPPGTGVIAYGSVEEYYVYRDPCHWRTTMPETPATTVDALVAALQDQAPGTEEDHDPLGAETWASEPTDISVGGYSGKSITLHAPSIFAHDCDSDQLAYFASEDDAPARYLVRGGPDQVSMQGQDDELWILDVNGQIVVLDIAYYDSRTPQSVVDELRSILASATLDVP